MSTSDGLSEGDNSDASTSTSTSTGAVTFSVIVPEGSYWRANGNQQPRIFDKPGKLICDCPNHNQSQWPMQNAELTIAPCAYKCPYCNEFNKPKRPKLMAPNLRRHINLTHIGNPARFETLVVAAGLRRHNRIDINYPSAGLS